MSYGCHRQARDELNSHSGKEAAKSKCEFDPFAGATAPLQTPPSQTSPSQSLARKIGVPKTPQIFDCAEEEQQVEEEGLIDTASKNVNQRERKCSNDERFSMAKMAYTTEEGKFTIPFKIFDDCFDWNSSKFKNRRKWVAVFKGYIKEFNSSHTAN